LTGAVKKRFTEESLLEKGRPGGGEAVRIWCGADVFQHSDLNKEKIDVTEGDSVKV